MLARAHVNRDPAPNISIEKDDDGNFIWPGFGDNSRVLKWICRRCDGEGETVETPIGLVPAEGQLDTEGLDISADQMAELLRVDRELLREQLPQVKEHLARFGDRLPDEVQEQLDALERRVGDA